MATDIHNDEIRNSKHEYDGIASAYDRTRFSTLQGRIFKFLRERILKKLRRQLPDGGLALDVACGTGLISEWLIKNRYRVISGDLSLGMLKIANEKLKSSDAFLGVSELNACALPFRSKSFDLVTSFRFLNLMSPKKRVMIHREVARVGKGFYAFTYALDSPYQRMRSGIKVRLRIGEGADSYPATLGNIKKELADAHIDYLCHFNVLYLVTSEIVILASIKNSSTSLTY